MFVEFLAFVIVRFPDKYSKQNGSRFFFMFLRACYTSKDGSLSLVLSINLSWKGVLANRLLHPEDYSDPLRRFGETSTENPKLTVQDEKAFQTACLLTKKEGIFAGMSSGAAVAAALDIAAEVDEGTIVAILPDREDRYLSTVLFRSVCGTWNS